MPNPSSPDSSTPSPRDTRVQRGPSTGDDPDRGQASEPRLPNEHDESTHGTQSGGPTRVGQQAHQDVERGLVDTDKQPVMERAYRQQK